MNDNNFNNNQLQPNVNPNPINNVPANNQQPNINDNPNPINNIPMNEQQMVGPMPQQVYQPQPTINPKQTINTPINEQPSSKSHKKTFIIILLVIIGIIILITSIVAVKYFTRSNSKDKQIINELFGDDALILVKKDEKYGYIDLEGNFVLQPQYDRAYDFKGDYAIVRTKTMIDNKEENIYEVIDKKGNVKATANYSSDIEYYEDYGIWVVNYQLYDKNFKKISPDNVSVDYEEKGFLVWYNRDASVAGIMDNTGKITYTYNFLDGESYLGFDVSSPAKGQKDTYCRVTVENEKYGIVNCNTGKVVYDYISNFVFEDSCGVFRVEEKDTYGFISKLYVQDDEIIYQSNNKNIDFSCYDNYILLIDYDKDYDNGKYSYLDMATKQISNTKPETKKDIKVNLSEWEEYTKMTKISCGSNYGLSSDDKIVVPCEWTKINYLDLSLYKYLVSRGKKYILATKDDKTYLLDLKDGKSVAEFNNNYIDSDDASIFLVYKDKELNQRVVYNIENGKSMPVEDKDSLYIKPKYFKLENNGITNYYNYDLKLIYTEQ